MSGQAAFDWASLPLSLYLSLFLQCVYDRFAAELHLYLCVYLLINDLVIDGLHGMFYRGGPWGQMWIWGGSGPVSSHSNGHTFTHEPLRRWRYSVSLKIKLWRALHLLCTLKTTSTFSDGSIRGTTLQQTMWHTHTIVYTPHWVISCHSVTFDLNVILCDKWRSRSSIESGH